MILTDDEVWSLWNSQGTDDMNMQEAATFARAIELAVAAAVAKRCADLCAATGLIAADMYGDGAECISTADLCADAIRREFGEVSNG